MKTTYPLRLDEDEAAELALLAQIDDLTLADELRQAIRHHLEQKRRDPEFQKRLRASRERNEELYARLSPELVSY
jgi:hypothetical protein